MVTGSALVTLNSLAASEILDDEETFQRTFPGPVVLVPLPADDDDVEDASRTGILAVGTARDREPRPQPRDVSAFVDAAIFSLGKGGAGELTTIGRASENDIAVPSPGISSRHGVFTADATGCWAYIDGGSTNGSSINGQRAVSRRPVILRDGDEIALASDLRLLFLAPQGLRRLALVVRAGGKPS